MGDLCDNWAEGDNQGPEAINEDSEESGNEVQEISAGEDMAYCECCDQDYPAEDLDHFLSCGLEEAASKVAEDEVELHNRETFDEDLDLDYEPVIEPSKDDVEDDCVVLDKSVDREESKSRTKKRSSVKWPSEMTEETKDELEEMIKEGLTVYKNLL